MKISMRQIRLKTGISDGLTKKLLAGITTKNQTSWPEKQALQIINEYLHMPTEPPKNHYSLSGCAPWLGLHKRYLFLAAKEYGLKPSGYYRSKNGRQAYYSLDDAKAALQRMNVSAKSISANYPTPFGLFPDYLRAQMAVINSAFNMVTHGHQTA